MRAYRCCGSHLITLFRSSFRNARCHRPLTSRVGVVRRIISAKRISKLGMSKQLMRMDQKLPLCLGAIRIIGYSITVRPSECWEANGWCRLNHNENCLDLLIQELERKTSVLVAYPDTPPSMTLQLGRTLCCTHAHIWTMKIARLLGLHSFWNALITIDSMTVSSAISQAWLVGCHCSFRLGH